jgi:phosphatidylglycerophosphate synthase
MRFVEALRSSDGILTGIERRCLIWLAGRMPRFINSDHLTGLALAAMALVGCAYWLSSQYPFALLIAVLGLAVNWFGDSLDGTLARVRQRQRPRYGFYVDHTLDTLGALFVVAGLGLSGHMSPWIAGAVLIAYYLLTMEIYLATYCTGTFQMSFWKMGPTELRILLALGTLTLLVKPTTTIGGIAYRIFDVAGVAAAAVLVLTAVVSMVRNTRKLYRAEPLPSAGA